MGTKEKRSSNHTGDIERTDSPKEKQPDSPKAERTSKRSSIRHASSTLGLEATENAAESGKSHSEAAKLTKPPSTHKLSKPPGDHKIDSTSLQSPSSRRRNTTLSSAPLEKAQLSEPSSPVPKMDKKSRRSSLPKDQSFTMDPPSKVEKKPEKPVEGAMPKSPKSKHAQTGNSKASPSPRDGHSVKTKQETSGTATTHKRHSTSTDSRKFGSEIVAGTSSRSSIMKKMPAK